MDFTPPLPTPTKRDHNNPVFKVSLTAKPVNVHLCQVTKFSLYLSDKEWFHIIFELL